MTPGKKSVISVKNATYMAIMPVASLSDGRINQSRRIVTQYARNEEFNEKKWSNNFNSHNILSNFT
jgi:hypothetical protein